MTIEITVPPLGESVGEATVASWFKNEGDAVRRDEPLLELETDKATLEVPAPASGILSRVLIGEGQEASEGAVLARVDAAGAPAEDRPAPETAAGAAAPLSPAVRRMVAEHGLEPAAMEGSGKGGRLTKADVQRHLASAERAPAAAAETAEAAAVERTVAPASEPAAEGREERVRMTRLRRRVAERLKAAQDSAAMLTTFNEVDMSAVMAARRDYRERFEKKHGVRLGFMSFFVKAAVQALRDIPAINGEIDGDDIVYKRYYHIGVAVSAPQGLVVPVLRDADRMGFAEIEAAIGDMARKARDGALTPAELAGGTFTITNGGIFGSLMSTPILNPPQSGILGMHKIEQRAVVVEGGIVARPRMYLALTYDHRIVDGREAVTFLVRVKDAIEDPQRLLLEV